MKKDDKKEKKYVIEYKWDNNKKNVNNVSIVFDKND
jgi:hypothetical protein